MLSSKGKQPLRDDIAAVFHVSFHPTKGNTIDWQFCSENIDLSGIEFKVLPSGLHAVDDDVVFFTHLTSASASSTSHGVSIFTRIPTTEKTYRGFRLEALGILLHPVSTPRPWIHVVALRTLAEQLHSLSIANSPSVQEHGKNVERGPEEARVWFEEGCAAGLGEASTDKKARSLGSQTWEDDLDVWLDNLLAHDPALPLDIMPTTPLLVIPHLLHTLGPSALTIFRFLLAQRRVLVLTKPRVEAVGLACWALAELASLSGQARNATGVDVKGTVTLHDIDILGSKSDKGWIASTTDTIFVDKTECFDLLVDLREVTLSTSSTSSTAECAGYGRAKLQVPKGTFEHNSFESVSKKRERGLSNVRFTWSDVRLWSHVSRVLQTYTVPTTSSFLSPQESTSRPPPGPVSSANAAAAWLDSLTKIYEDACILCASAWFSSNAPVGALKLEGEDDLPTRLPRTYGRNRGMSASNAVHGHDQGRRQEASGSTSVADVGEDGSLAMDGLGTTPRARKRQSSASSMWSLPVPLPGSWSGSWIASKTRYSDVDEDPSMLSLQDGSADEEEIMRARRAAEAHVELTRLLVKAFQVYSERLFATLQDLLAPHLKPTSSHHLSHARDTRGHGTTHTVVLTPKDLTVLELGPLSAMDARFVEWLANAYFGDHAVPEGDNEGRDTRVVVRKIRWRDVVGVIFGW